MSAGFIHAPPQLWNINPPRQDQRKRSSVAYQVLLLFRFLGLVLVLAFSIIPVDVYDTSVVPGMLCLSSAYIA